MEKWQNIDPGPAGDHDSVRAAVLAPEAGHQVWQVPAGAPPLLPQQRGAAAGVQVTNHSTAFGHETTVLTSDWCSANPVVAGERS